MFVIYYDNHSNIVYFVHDLFCLTSKIRFQLSSEENKMLVREFLSFDDEITLVEGMWTDVEARINQYT